jgi:hypothetical protein
MLSVPAEVGLQSIADQTRCCRLFRMPQRVEAHPGMTDRDETPAL